MRFKDLCVAYSDCPAISNSYDASLLAFTDDLESLDCRDSRKLGSPQSETLIFRHYLTVS